ncbi:MAG: hypothetical protein ACREJU_19465 [Nitrospiraceae bacterium]
MLLLVGFVAVCFPATAWAESPSSEKPDLVLPEEYPVYDLVIRSKFLTSETTLVKIHRMTVTRLGEEEKPLGREFFAENEYFDGRVPPALLNEFLAKLRRPSRLDPRFHFGVRYRLVSDQQTDDTEASLAPIPAGFAPIEYDGSIIQLEFSRVAFNAWKDQALVYVGNYRADGSGAGFLVLLLLRDRAWEIVDTEVIWTAQVRRRP